MVKVTAILRPAGPEFPCIMPQSPLAEACRLIARARACAVLVTDQTGRLLGMITESDIVRLVATRAMGIRGLAVEEVMGAPTPALQPDASVQEAIRMMDGTELRHLPVCSAEGHLLGIVARRDLHAAPALLS